MALNIGELIAYLKMDKADWDAAKRSAKRDLEDIADQADKSGKKVDQSTKDTAKKVESNFKRSFNPLAFGLLFAGLPAAAAGASLAAAGSLALVSGGFIALTAIALRQNPLVAQSVSALGAHIKDSLGQMAGPLAQDYVKATTDIGNAFDRLQPQISAAMRNASGSVHILTDGVTGLAEEAMPGLVVATNRADPALRGLSQLFIYTGRGATDFFMNLSTGSAGAGRDLEVLGRMVQGLLGFVGQLVANLANNGGPALTAFSGGLTIVEHVLLTLTAAGSQAYAMFGGFINTVSGGLAIIQLLVSVLSLLPPGIGQFGGQLLATSKILAAFGVNAFAAFDGLGQKIKDAEGNGAKLKAGFNGLVDGAFSPATIAVTLLTFGLGALGQAQQNAAAAAAAHTSPVGDLARSLRDSSGAITANTRAQAASTLVDFDAGDGKRNLLKDVQGLLGDRGVTMLTDAYLGNKDAGAQLAKEVQALAVAHTDGGGAMDDVAMKALDLQGTLQEVGGTFDSAVQKNQLLATASGDAGTAVGQLSYSQKLAQAATRDLATAFKGLADTESDAATKGKLLQTVLDTLNGRTPSHEEAIQSINDALRSLSQEFGKGANKADGWGKALLNADGTVNTASKNGSALQDTLVQLESGFANAGASIDDLVKSGKPLEAATKQVSGELTTQRQKFIDAAGAMGITKAQAEQLANKYGLIPAEVVTNITQPGMPNAQQAADILRGKVLSVPDSHTTITSALTADAIAKLQALGYTVKTLPNGTVAVYADTSSAQTVIDRFINNNSSRYIQITTRVSDPSGALHSSTARFQAAGGLLAPGIAAYAGGGVRNLTPMSAAVARVVSPDTWRIIGDNMRVREAFIPLDRGSRQAQSILDQANAEMGRYDNDNSPAAAVPQQRAIVHIGEFHPPANASPADIAEELDWLSRTGG